ncbi:MAG: hypothetical protein QXW97_02745 [Candidatus Pacearchaeota archaeon]
MKTIFDIYSKEEIEKIIKQIHIAFNNGYKDDEILKKVNLDMIEELISLAKARLEAQKEFSKKIYNVKYFNIDDLRFGTPVSVAEFRAKKLKCNKIVDLCSGIGLQSFAFSKQCSEVLSVEIDERKSKYSIMNFGEQKNITFICGDVLSKEIVKKVSDFKPDIIFCDSERQVNEKERSLQTIKPNLKDLISIYEKICPNICIEIPPRIDLEKLKDLDCEKEYLSLNSKLNRLDLNFGNLKKFDVKVVDVESGVYIFKDSNVNSIKVTDKINSFIYELSEAVIKADLINEIGELINADLLKFCEENKVLLTNKTPNVDFKHLADCYKVIGISKNIDNAINILKKESVGKVVIKYSINPKYYWKERNRYENNIRGKKEVFIFKIFNKKRKISYVICERLT